MNKKTYSGMMLTLLLIGILTLAFNIQPVKASGTIYIRPDGTIDPPTAPIQHDGDVYAFTDNIYDSILILERDNIVVDGADYTIQGTGDIPFPWYTGMTLSARSNVTVKNLRITGFSTGIRVESSSNIVLSGNNLSNNVPDRGIGLWDSRTNTLVGNTLSNNNGGIDLKGSDNNTLVNNSVSSNVARGIQLVASNDNMIVDNSVSSNVVGIRLYSVFGGYTSGNLLSGNSVSNNNIGIHWEPYRSNIIYHNNFINNTIQVWTGWAVNPGQGVWDDGYPSGGNYWSDYEGSDIYFGPYQNETGCDGIGDTPYVIDDYNQDNYPLMEPWTPVPDDTTPPVTTITFDGTLGNNGWYTSDVTVTLSATDDISGVNRTEYSFDNSTWAIYDTPFVVTTEGVTTVYYRSIDAAGNVETTKSESIKMDRTAPAITVTLSAPAYGVTYTQADTLTITYTGTDATSGLASISATLDSNPISNGESISLLWFSLGSHTIVVTACDNAENTAQEVVAFEIVATLDSLEATIEQLNSHGLIDNSQGIDNSLLSKLDAAQKLVQSGRPTTAAKNILNAFINEVQAQSGKHITPEAAEILIQSAEYIISNL